MTIKCLSAMFSISISLFIASVHAQTTSFSHQGQLNNNGVPVTGNVDFEFKLFDAIEGGIQQGSTIQRSSVAVANGVYSVTLDFGGASLPGANRFLEIFVRLTGGGAFTPLSPRQPLLSAPYAVRSLSSATADNATNAAQLGGVSASQYLQSNGNGSALSNLNASSVSSGTIANARLGQIPTANIADGAVTSPKIANGQVVKSVNSLTDSVTLTAGANITITPAGNTLTIASTGGSGGIQNQTTVQAGANFNIGGNGIAGGFLSGSTVNAADQYTINGNRVLSVAGTANLFVGTGTGQANTTGESNAFFGRNAGQSNSEGFENSFFGRNAGRSNTLGNLNTFFGANAGDLTTIGFANAFFGREAGRFNQTGNQNAFFGGNAGESHLTGSNNTFFGYRAGRGNTTGDNNVFVGGFAGQTNTTGDSNTVVGYGADVGSVNLTFATAIGAGAVVNSSDTVTLGRDVDVVRVPGTLRVNSLGNAGATALCQNASNFIATCSSSRRYKENISEFSLGLDIIRRLRPVTFNWKDGGMYDLGLIAEDVADLEPLLVTYGTKGEVEGLKYDRIGVVLVNAVREQQKQIDEQRIQIEALTRIVCALIGGKEGCKPAELPK